MTKNRQKKTSLVYKERQFLLVVSVTNALIVADRFHVIRLVNHLCMQTYQSIDPHIKYQNVILNALRTNPEPIFRTLIFNFTTRSVLQASAIIVRMLVNSKKYSAFLGMFTQELHLLENTRELIRKNCAASPAELIAQLNPRIRGWANYYRHGVAKSTYSYVDEQIFTAIWRWIKRKHPEKNTQWLRKKYFLSQGLRNWIFYAKRPATDSSTSVFLDLVRANHTPIKRHVKIRGQKYF